MPHRHRSNDQNFPCLFYLVSLDNNVSNSNSISLLLTSRRQTTEKREEEEKAVVLFFLI